MLEDSAASCKATEGGSIPVAETDDVLASLIDPPRVAASHKSDSLSTEHVLDQFPPPPRQDPLLTNVRRHGRNKSLSITVRPYSSNFVPNHTRQAASISSLAYTPSLAIASPPSGDANFLTALAAQERRVLELREQLAKAEEQLVNLKKQWVTHEATRRRGDSRPASAATSSASALTASSAAAGDEQKSGDWLRGERERRMSITSRPSSSSGRRVFPSSKTSQPLSLVSIPALETKRMSDPMPEKPEGVSSTDESSFAVPKRPGRSVTISDGIDTIPEEASVRSMRESEQMSLHRKSVALAADIREGLWTFFEDLRQATVGDEARPTQAYTSPATAKEAANPRETGPAAPRERRRKMTSPGKASTSPKSSKTDPSRHAAYRGTLIEVGGAMWKNDGTQGVSIAEKAASEKKQRSRKPKATTEERDVKGQTLFFEDDDAWDNWPEPTSTSPDGHAAHRKYPSSDRSQSSASVYQDSPSTVNTGVSSSRSSIDDSASQPARGLQAQEASSTGFQWSNVAKRASQLRTSALSIMDDWEKSINVADGRREMGSPIDQARGLGGP